jgi:hypothetical protein
VEVKVRENPFLKEKIRLGGPDIKPEKATMIPVIKEIPQRKRPPEPIRDIKVKELKEKRPLVREKEASVLRPQSTPGKMPVKPVEKPRVERPKEIGPTEKRTGEPGPVEKGVEKPRPAEKRIEKPKEFKPAEKGVDKPREIRPPEKAVEKPGAVEKKIEKPREQKPSEKEVRKQGESRQAEEGIKDKESPRK